MNDNDRPKVLLKGQALAQRVATLLTAGSGLLLLALLVVLIFIVRRPVAAAFIPAR